MRIYAGVGPREGVPVDVLDRAKKIASELRDAGWLLRSGGALGMDQAFESGAGDQKEIFGMEDCTQAAYRMASGIHPGWLHLSHRAKLLHGRNCMIVLGADLRTPVEYVVYWYPGEGDPDGGTGMTVKIAKLNGIQTVNLWTPVQTSLVLN